MTDQIKTGDVDIPDDAFENGFVALWLYDKKKTECDSLRAQLKSAREVIEWCAEHRCNCGGKVDMSGPEWKMLPPEHGRRARLWLEKNKGEK